MYKNFHFTHKYHFDTEINTLWYIFFLILYSYSLLFTFTLQIIKYSLYEYLFHHVIFRIINFLRVFYSNIIPIKASYLRNDGSQIYATGSTIFTIPSVNLLWNVRKESDSRELADHATISMNERAI